MATNISVCIITHLLEERLKETLLSYRSCHEILLGFNGDADALAAFVFPDIPNLKIVKLPWQGYGPTKNALAAEAGNDWILSVDADEVADETLQQSLRRFAPGGENQVHSLRIRNYLGEQEVKHGAWGKGKQYFNRLYHRSYTAWNEAAVHETIMIPAGSKVVPLDGSVKHYTAESLAAFTHKNEYYARLSAEKYFELGKKSGLLKRFGSPLFTFVKQYFVQLGFLDGAAGLHIALGNARYTFRKYQLLSERKELNR